MTVAEIIENIDTSALARGDSPAKALVIVNASGEAFVGIGVLAANFPTRSPGMPVCVYAPSGRVMPSRIIDERIGPGDELGRRRWSFTLEFLCTAPPRSAIAYGAVFAAESSFSAIADNWFGERLAAFETECRVGPLSNPCQI